MAAAAPVAKMTALENFIVSGVLRCLAGGEDGKGAVKKLVRY
jgi:hypothetical protein